MEIPKCYHNAAKAIINAFYNTDRPILTKAQVKAQITHMVEVKTAEDGSPADWTACQHCIDGIYYSPLTDREHKDAAFQAKAEIIGAGWVNRGLCFQCYGKGAQSAADRRRNWGYRKIIEDRDRRMLEEELKIGRPRS